MLYRKGDIDSRIFIRSSAKPIQVIPFIHSRASEVMGFSHKEIAIACASHTGERMHQETVLGILNRLGLNQTHLHCGITNPCNEEERKRLIKLGKEPSTLHAGCSGKHAAMLAYSIYKGADISNYEDRSHPVQQEILKTIAEFTDEDEDSITLGTDGCGLPTFMLPIRKIALSYARIAGSSQDGSSKYHRACKTVFDAMTQYPEMVAGTGEFCTELMSATNGKLIGKIGSEAVYCLGIKKDNLGVCIKIADGSKRAVYPVVIEILMQLGVLDGPEYEKLKNWHKTKLLNQLKEPIGYIVPVFNLNRKVYPGKKIEV